MKYGFMGAYVMNICSGVFLFIPLAAPSVQFLMMQLHLTLKAITIAIITFFAVKFVGGMLVRTLVHHEYIFKV